MQNYGIRVRAGALIKDDPADRNLVVKMGDIISSKPVRKVSVPQGTILGPILFIIYKTAFSK